MATDGGTKGGGERGYSDRYHQHDIDPETLKVIGKPFRKVDARSKVTGRTLFADDIVLPRMLHMKILRSTEAHALIKDIDISEAEKLPGVVGILLRKELPITFGILPVSQDEHTLCIDKVRMVGDPVVSQSENPGAAASLSESTGVVVSGQSMARPGSFQATAPSHSGA